MDTKNMEAKMNYIERAEKMKRISDKFLKEGILLLSEARKRHLFRIYQFLPFSVIDTITEENFESILDLALSVSDKFKTHRKYIMRQILTTFQNDQRLIEQKLKNQPRELIDIEICL